MHKFVRFVRRLGLRSAAAGCAVREAWLVSGRASIPDAETGIESATRHSELTDKIDRVRKAHNHLLVLADYQPPILPHDFVGLRTALDKLRDVETALLVEAGIRRNTRVLPIKNLVHEAYVLIEGEISK